MPRGEYRMSRDGRNPYGSAGGYVVSRRSRRDRAMRGGRGRDYEMDYAMRRDYGMDYARSGRGREGSRDYEMDYNYDMRSGRDYEMDYARNISYSGSYGGTPFQYRKMEDYGRDYRGGYDYGYHYPREDYRYDYAMGNLGKEEIEDFSEKLMHKIDSKDREMLKKEKVIKKAEEMGIKFEMFTPEEFYITTLMMYTDYCKVLGNASLDIYLRLAKAWLMDDDTQVKAGEKLAVYYDEIVGAED